VAPLALSRFAGLRALQDRLVLESPLSPFRVTLTDARAAGVLALLAKPQPLRTLAERTGLPSCLVQSFAELLWGGYFLAADPEPDELRVWDFHSLAFHACRRLHDLAPPGPKERNADAGPIVKPPMGTARLSLDVPGSGDTGGAVAALDAVMEARRSIRRFDEERPISKQQLGELLYRVGRVKRIFPAKDKFCDLSGSSDPDAMLTERSYPGGGARYELELYAIVRRCDGLEAGLYHYDPLHHQLENITAPDEDLAPLLADAHAALGRQGVPQVLLIVTARFGRILDAYRSLGYSLILRDAGVLYQSLYLVATAMGLAPCALGEIDAERFGRACALARFEEGVVGAFVVGTIGEETPNAGSDEDAVQTVSAGAGGGAMPEAGPAMPATGHDLDDRVPGLAGLREATLGDRRITIVVLDGDPDLTLTCFRGGDVAKKYPYWHERAEPITAEQHALYRAVSESGDDDGTRERLTSAFPPPVLTRIIGDRHATHITSTIAGQPGSPVAGLAPSCRVIVVPLNEPGDPGEFMSSLNLARGFEFAQELGADIIHCAVCVPTRTDQPHELLARAIESCRDAGILIVAPVGNDGGDCRCIPAVLPGTLAVGASRDDGRPFAFSNWGGNYSTDGIMAPGERILCAQPFTEQPVREKGTSLAAPVMTGIAALLMSRQLQLGRPVEAEAVRRALLSTSRPCDPSMVEEPERCLRGVLDLPAAIDALFGSPAEAPSNLVSVFGADALASQSDASAGRPRTPADVAEMPDAELSGAVTVSAIPTAVEPSTAHSGLVFALGRLSLDLASDIGRQTLQQNMALEADRGELPGADPDEPRDLIAYLDRHPTERRCVIWTLEMDGGPIYALEPEGAYADEIYETLLALVAGELVAQEAAEFVERVSIPGRRTGRTVQLLSRAEVPVLALTDVRGIYGWQINSLVRDAVASVAPATDGADRVVLRDAVTNFLARVYFELHNLGLTSRDRAMNFAATNCVQSVTAFARAVAEGRTLERIFVDKSPVCRMHSDCWEVYLTFYDPDSGRRATRVFQFTVDVSDLVPVTVGAVKTWMQRRAE
jgi:SagB-type dehydrogenase family enzyme